MGSDALECFLQNCAECGELIPLQWQNGLIYDRNKYTLVADWVFHNECWDKLVERNPTDGIVH